jgi:hypothetical protein
MMIALLLALSTPAQIAAWEGVPVPDEAATPYAQYLGCISDPVLDMMESGHEQAPAERDAMMNKLLADCRPKRAETVVAMDASLAQVPDWTDPVLRRAKVERILDAAEERVGFTARDPEGFQAMVETMRQCISAGRKDCDATPPTPSQAN